MKLLLIYVLLNTHGTAAPTDVYICDSSGGKKYHLSQNCRGLSNCSHRIVKITLAEAKRRGKTMCGYEK